MSRVANSMGANSRRTSEVASDEGFDRLVDTVSLFTRQRAKLETWEQDLKRRQEEASKQLEAQHKQWKAAKEREEEELRVKRDRLARDEAALKKKEDRVRREEVKNLSMKLLGLLIVLIVFMLSSFWAVYLASSPAFLQFLCWLRREAVGGTYSAHVIKA